MIKKPRTRMNAYMHGYEQGRMGLPCDRLGYLSSQSISKLVDGYRAGERARKRVEESSK